MPAFIESILILSGATAILASAAMPRRAEVRCRLPQEEDRLSRPVRR